VLYQASLRTFVKHTLLLVLLLTAALVAMAQEPAASGTAQARPPAQPPYLTLPSLGLSFPVSYKGEALGNPAGGYRQGAIYDGLLEAGVTIDLGKLANWQGATLTVDGLYPHGSSLTRNDVRDFNVLSNIDAVHSPRLYEAWLEQDLDGGKFSIRVGQVAIDSEFFISTNGALFINSAFGVLPSVSMNMNVAVYPVAAPGVWLKATPNDSWSVQGGVYDGSVGDLHTTNRSGLRFNLNGRDGALLIGEVAYTLHPPPAADGKQPPAPVLSGTYKLGGFYNTDDFPADTTGHPPHGDYGFYVIMDQNVWQAPGSPGQGLQAFGRVSAAPGDRNQVEFYTDGGLDYTGLFPGRNQDVMGLGLSYTKLSNALRNAQGNPYPNHYEAIVELTYQAVMTPWLNVQPDLQYIFNPGALGTEPDALVVGLRFNMTF
jgi:porin